MLIWAAPLGLVWPPFLSSFSNNGDVLVPRNLIFLDYLHWPCFLIIYRLCCLVAIYYMWKARNCLRFQNRSLPFQHAKNLINSHLSFLEWLVHEVVIHLGLLIVICIYFMPSVHPHLSSQSFGIHQEARAPWIKINTDGLVKGNQGLAAMVPCFGFNGAF